MKSKSKLLFFLILVGLSIYSDGFQNPGEAVTAIAAGQPALTVGVFCPTKNEEAKALYNTGVDLGKADQLEKAAQAYLKAIELDGNYCDAMDNLGQLLRRQGKLDEAVYWYRRSIGVFPNNPAAHGNLAVAYHYQGKMDEAISEYQILLKMNPDDPEGYYGLGTVYSEKGELNLAAQNFLRAEQLYSKLNSPLIADAKNALGMTYYRLRDYGKSRGYLEQIYTQKHDNRQVNYVLGLCHLREGNITQARVFLKRAQELGIKIPPGVKAEAGL
jgi:Flp pilus assembly protein TadD